MIKLLIISCVEIYFQKQRSEECLDNTVTYFQKISSVDEESQMRTEPETVESRVFVGGTQCFHIKVELCKYTFNWPFDFCKTVYF